MHLVNHENTSEATAEHPPWRILVEVQLVRPEAEFSMVLLAQAWARLEYGDLRETIFRCTTCGEIVAAPDGYHSHSSTGYLR
jgi:formylmethanofuran dehydrogenase subunit E